MPTPPPSTPLAPASSRLRESALYEQVAERLRARILSHSLAPGSWIDEQALATEFGISRTPLREALKVLAGEGLVTMKLRRGAYVTEVSARDLSEVFHLLALLESDAAAQVAARATDAQLAELQALHDALERTVDERDAFFRANEQFHLKLLQIADNRWTQAMVGDLRRVMKLNRHQSLLKQGRLEASLTEHRKIMQALQARDAAKVKRLMEQHIHQGREAAAHT
jgi:DNA-binding GntR family transcriptional regulator